MKTTTKIAAIAVIALLGLAAYWGVTHLAKLIIIFAILGAVAVVAGPTVGRLRAKVTKREEPRVVTGEDIDWAAMVMNYQLPAARPTTTEQQRNTHEQGR